MFSISLYAVTVFFFFFFFLEIIDFSSLYIVIKFFKGFNSSSYNVQR